MTNTERIIKYIATAFAALLAVTIIVTILQAGLILTKGTSGLNGKTTSDTQNFQLNEIKTIDIKNDVSDVKFVVDDDATMITVEAKEVSTKYSCTLNDGTLQIKNKKASVFSFFNKDPRVIIHIPQDMALDKLVLNCGVGDVHINSLKLDIFKVKGGVGDITVRDCTIEHADFDMGVGDMDMKDSILKNAKIDNGVGDVELSLNGNIEDYDFDIDNGLGEVEINGKSAKNFKENNGLYKITVDNGVGDVDIDIK